MSRKGLNIYKRKDGRWEARYIKSRNALGKPKYGYLYASSYREVRCDLQHTLQLQGKLDSAVANNDTMFSFHVRLRLYISRCNRQQLFHVMNDTVIVHNFSRKSCLIKIHNMTQVDRNIFCFCQFKNKTCAVISAC